MYVCVCVCVCVCVKIFPLSEHWKMVLILDDNRETWDRTQEDGRNSVQNLIVCEKVCVCVHKIGLF